MGAGFLTRMFDAGMGRHIECLPPEKRSSLLLLASVLGCLNVIGIGLVKISVCLCLLRVVDKARSTLTRFPWCLLVFVAISHLGLPLSFVFFCKPVSALWNPRISDGCRSWSTTILALVCIGFSETPSRRQGRRLTWCQVLMF